MTSRIVGAVFALMAATASAHAQTLEAFASFPADTFAPGPTSGQFITPANGRTPPFVEKQRVQGVSSVLHAGKGRFIVMSDNGFGAKANSVDYVPRMYRVAPHFRTKHHGLSLKARRYTGRQWFYRMESAANAIGDLTAVTDRLFLVIERDNSSSIRSAQVVVNTTPRS